MRAAAVLAWQRGCGDGFPERSIVVSVPLRSKPHP